MSESLLERVWISISNIYMYGTETYRCISVEKMWSSINSTKIDILNHVQNVVKNGFKNGSCIMVQ